MLKGNSLATLYAERSKEAPDPPPKTLTIKIEVL